jgi:hypothetical protein
MKINFKLDRKIKIIILMGLGFIIYNILTFVLLLRDIRAILIMHNFYPAISDTIMSLRLSILERGLNSYPTIAFILLSAGLFFVYYYLLREKLSKINILLSAVSFQLIVLFSWPILSTDIFYYILSDRVATVYHQNVWKVPTEKFPNDPFFHLTDWRGQTKIYGPVNQFFYNLPSLVTGGDLFLSLLLYKGLVIIFVVATLILLLRQFPKANSPGLSLVAAVFLNPLFIIETAGSGHNDILMLFFGVLAAILFLNDRLSLSAISLAVAAGVKIPILALAPFLIGSLISVKKIISGIIFGLLFFILGFVLLLTMDVPLSAFVTRTFYSTNLHWQSLPTVLRAYVPTFETWWHFALVPVIGVQFWRLIFRKENPFLLFVETLLVYLLFFAESLWNWYAIWPLVFVPFLKSDRLVRAILAFTFSSLIAYGFFWLSLRFNYTAPIWTVIIYGLIVIPPIGVYFYDRLAKKE